MLGDVASSVRRMGSALSSIMAMTILGTTLSATITNGYNISDTAVVWLNNNGAGNGSVLGDVASSIATSDASAVSYYAPEPH